MIVMERIKTASTENVVWDTGHKKKKHLRRKNKANQK